MMRTHQRKPRGQRTGKPSQAGVVLVVAIVLLAIVSILAAFSTRNAASAENVSGNVRLTELATQAAEIALRHCEDSVAEVIAVDAGAEPSYDTDTFTLANILPEAEAASWESPTNWDSPTAPVYVVPLARVNQPDLKATYKRPPECMVAPLPFVTPSGAISTTAAFIVTARGFGPDVSSADADRSRPVGTEVWLQSHIELQ